MNEEVNPKHCPLYHQSSKSRYLGLSGRHYYVRSAGHLKSAGRWVV